jgi:hypothetical protein
MQQITQNWQLLFIRFLIVGILLFLLFRLVFYLFPILLKNKKADHRIRRLLPFAEAATWLAFFSWYSLKFYALFSVYTLVVLGFLFIIFFWISRFLVKELIAGMVFRVSARFSEGDRIQTKQYTGTIKKYHFDAIELEAADGQIIFIPYSQLAGEVTIKKESAGQTTAYSFRLITYAKDESVDMAEEIKFLLLSLPWSSVHTPPQVNLVEQAGNQYKFDVTCYPVDKSYAKKMEQRVLDKFGV